MPSPDKFTSNSGLIVDGAPHPMTEKFQELIRWASNLNDASDLLGTRLLSLNEKLKALNVGVECWVPVYDGSAWELGYAKVGKWWGLSIAYKRGNESAEEWPIGDAPRFIRADAMVCLPLLLDALIDETKATINKVQMATRRAQDILSKLV